MSRRLGRWAGALALVLCASAPSRADEPKRTSGDDSTLRFFHVDALVAGRSDFVSERSGFGRANEVNDEEHPLFGCESEETTRPVGGVDELIELLKSEVEQDSWGNTSGVDVRALGSNLIVAQHRPEALAAFGAAIKRWEDRWLRTVTIDIQAVRMPAEPGAAPTDLAALVQSPAAGPGVSLTAFPGQRVSAFAGRQRACVTDYGVAVAQKSKAGDPFVNVVNLGLAVDVRATPLQGDTHLVLSLRGALTELLGTSTAKVVEGGSVETLVLGTTSIQCGVDVAAGAWTLVDGATLEGEKPGWTFAVRARVNARAPREARRGDSLPVLGNAGMGRLVRRTYDVDALKERVPSRQAPVSSLFASNFTPPEPPELPEPRCALEPEHIQDLVRTAIAPEVWEQGALEVKGGTLIVRAPETVHAAVGRMLASLQHHLMWAAEVNAEVVEVPAALAAAQETLLSEEGSKELTAALKGGTATRIDVLRVAAAQSTRNFVAAGRQRSYVRDFDVEIAEDSAIGKPVIGVVFAGAVLDVQPSINSTWDGAAIAVRFQRTWLPDELPTFATSWGTVQVPEMRSLRIRTNLEVPFGRTAVVGSFVENGRRTLLLLTPTLRRVGD